MTDRTKWRKYPKIVIDKPKVPEPVPKPNVIKNNKMSVITIPVCQACYSYYIYLGDDIQNGCFVDTGDRA